MFMNQSVLKQGNCKSFKFTHTHTNGRGEETHTRTHSCNHSRTRSAGEDGWLIGCWWQVPCWRQMISHRMSVREERKYLAVSLEIKCSWKNCTDEHLPLLFFYYLTKELGLGLYTRLWREEIFLRGPEGDKDGLREPRVVNIDGAGEGVEVHSLHGQVDARHEAL